MAKRSGPSITRPRKKSEEREDYHELLIEFREWCVARKFTFPEGMMLAIQQFMASNPAESIDAKPAAEVAPIAPE